MRHARRLLGTLAVALLPIAKGGAQPGGAHLRLEQYLDWEDVQSPRLSPDGRHGKYIACTGYDDTTDTWRDQPLYVMNADGSNPRGSTGYGSAFGDAIENAYPGKDFDDMMAGVDTVINRGFIDPSRLYVFGCSGGGVLTAWIVGHTDRFAAAGSNCPVTNWMSFVGTTDSPGWYRNFEKPFWEDHSEHLRRSPIMYVGNVKTPTMLMAGILDLRTPMPQTEEFYMALQYRKLPTAMIRFNDEWHGTSSTPSNFLRTQLYLRSWFARWPQKVAAQ